MKITGTILFIIITAGCITAKARSEEISSSTGNFFSRTYNQHLHATGAITSGHVVSMLQQSSKQFEQTFNCTQQQPGAAMASGNCKIYKKDIVQLLGCSGKFREFISRNSWLAWLFRLPTSSVAFEDALQAVPDGLNICKEALAGLRPESLLSVAGTLVQYPRRLSPLFLYKRERQYMPYLTLNIKTILHTVAPAGSLLLQHNNYAGAGTTHILNYNNIPGLSNGYKPCYGTV